LKIQEITKENFFSHPKREKKPWTSNYLIMYSSQWGGYTKDPDLMLIPIDDHLVHRGDGVFDVMRCVRGKIYQMDAHIERLERSARSIGLPFPPEYDDVRRLMKMLVGEGGERECLIRIVLARGPGSFSTNPYDCPSSQMYINVIRFQAPPEEYYRLGVALITSKTPIKKSFFANIKSCNYLPNVLMKKEAVEAGCPFSVALDEEGFLAEGSTENVGIVDGRGVLKFPGFERTLSGITVNRVFKLATQLVNEAQIDAVKFERITRDDAYQAKEMFLTGTSLGVVPVVRYDAAIIGEGVPGPVSLALSSLLWKDMTENGALLTEIEWAC
jgi:branched-chain amino acid aminotransferase